MLLQPQSVNKVLQLSAIIHDMCTITMINVESLWALRPCPYKCTSNHHQLSEHANNFQSNCVWLLALQVFVNRPVL